MTKGSEGGRLAHIYPWWFAWVDRAEARPAPAPPIPPLLSPPAYP